MPSSCRIFDGGLAQSLVLEGFGSHASFSYYSGLEPQVDFGSIIPWDSQYQSPRAP